jgi:hypothetical protein
MYTYNWVHRTVAESMLSVGPTGHNTEEGAHECVSAG